VISAQGSTGEGVTAEEGNTHPPPMIDIAQAPGRMMSEWARTSGRAKPVTTTTEVINFPRSSGPDPSSSVENSSEPQWENSALGRGAKTNVKAAFEMEPDQISSGGTRTSGRLRTDEEREPI